MKKSFKQHFTCFYRKERLLLKDDYNVIKKEIIAFIESKADNYEVIKKGEMEKLPHFAELPCSLETALTYELEIGEAFNTYIWALIQSGEIDTYNWDSFDEVVSSEIGYLTSEE